MGRLTFDKIKRILNVLLLVLFMSSLTAATVSAQRTVDVSIQNFAFNPASVQVSKGDTVRWTNIDSTDHTVTGSTFNSGLIHKGQSFEFQFTTPGSYSYICSIHPSMKGTVKVV